MKILLIMLAFTAPAAAHVGPDDGVHHALPWILTVGPLIVIYLKLAWNFLFKRGN